MACLTFGFDLLGMCKGLIEITRHLIKLAKVEIGDAQIVPRCRHSGTSRPHLWQAVKTKIKRKQSLILTSSPEWS